MSEIEKQKKTDHLYLRIDEISKIEAKYAEEISQGGSSTYHTHDEVLELGQEKAMLFKEIQKIETSNT